MNSRVERSAGKVRVNALENPNIVFSHDLKKNVGPIKYRKSSNIIANKGNRSIKKEKKRNSAIKKIEPGNPKNMRLFKRIAKNSFGVRKFTLVISVIKRVLKRLAIASTSKNELVESRAWLISIQKLANSRFELPLTTHIVSQCISITVEYATSFFRSIW